MTSRTVPACGPPIRRLGLGDDAVSNLECHCCSLRCSALRRVLRRRGRVAGDPRGATLRVARPAIGPGKESIPLKPATIRSKVRVPALLAGVAAIAMALPAVAEARTGPKITVMSRNLFLGADLAPAIGAPGIPQAIDGAGVIWNELQSTRFADRARPLAREIKPSNADLVGLQEVALWRTQTPSDGGAPPISPVPGATAATQVHADFLAILRQHLKAVGAQLPRRRRPEGVRRRAARRRRRLRRDRHRSARDLRRRLRRAAHDARRDPGPEGEQGEARRDPARVTSRPGTSPTSAASSSRSTAAGPRSRRRSGAGAGSAGSASSTPTSRRSATPRSARRRPRS